MVVTTRLLTPLLGLLGCSSVLSAPLAAASKSGVSITRNNSFVAMGEASDIRLQRVNDGELLVSASAVTFDAPVDIADLWVRTAHGATVPLSDFVQVRGACCQRFFFFFLPRLGVRITPIRARRA